MFPPALWWMFQQIWLSLALVGLTAFAWRLTLWTAGLYGALPAALTFLLMEVILVYTVLFATEEPPRSMGGVGGVGRFRF